MKILISNDDGFQAPGIVALYDALHDLGEVEVASSARILEQGAGSPADVLSQAILTSRGKSIRPKTLGQKSYVDAIDLHTIVFGIGPAGTGKTYLAMAKAVQALQRKERPHHLTRLDLREGHPGTPRPSGLRGRLPVRGRKGQDQLSDERGERISGHLV